MPLIPKVPIKGVSHVLTSPEVIAVGSALFVIPMVQPYIETWLNKLPFLREHRIIASVLVGIIFIIIAIKIKSRTVRAVLIGIGGGLFMLGVIPAVQDFIRR